MVSLGDIRFSKWEALRCNASRIVESAMISCEELRLNQSQPHDDDEHTLFLETTEPVFTIINSEEYLCSERVNTSNVKELLNYMCDKCSLSSVPHVEAAWKFGVCNTPPTNSGFNIAVFCFYVAILLAAIVGNTLVVFVVGGTAKMRTVTNYFILNLAVGDLLMAIFCIPFTFATTVILQYWPFGLEMCIAVNYLQGVTVFVSAYSLVAISIDRYLAIIYPLRPRMTRLQARVIIWLVWVMALITTAPLAVFSKLFVPHSNYYKVNQLKVCTEDWGDAAEKQAAYSAALMFLQYVLPVTVLVFTYTRIGLVVWGKKALGETPARHDRIARGKRKMIKMMVVVVLVYSLCWLPFNVLMVVRSIQTSVDSWSGMMYLWTAFHWLAMSHTCYNPIILCWMNNKFRSGFCYIGYHFPCLRRLVDSCFMSGREEDLMRATTLTSTHGGSRSSRLIVTISLKDDTIVFKSRHCNGAANAAQNSRAGVGPGKFLTALEESSSDSRL